ncbi:hypothetical protein DLH72_04710 [Candidatus Gracilibacteria bacterium]|nr:MAG: hypothetical protein DLH72_04710 [Candidatus Gracilibacteria bacterium]
MITIKISNPEIEKKFTKKQLEKIVNDYLENLEKEEGYDSWLFQNISESLEKHKKNPKKGISSKDIKSVVMEKVNKRFGFTS